MRSATPEILISPALVSTAFPAENTQGLRRFLRHGVATTDKHLSPPEFPRPRHHFGSGGSHSLGGLRPIEYEIRCDVGLEKIDRRHDPAPCHFRPFEESRPQDLFETDLERLRRRRGCSSGRCARTRRPDFSGPRLSRPVVSRARRSSTTLSLKAIPITSMSETSRPFRAG